MSFTEAVVQRCFVKRYSWKFPKIHRKTPVPGFSNIWRKYACKSKTLVSIGIYVVAKTVDEIYVLSINKIYSYFSFVFSVVSIKVDLLKIRKIIQLLWNSSSPCKNRRKENNTFFCHSLLHFVLFKKRNYQVFLKWLWYLSIAIVISVGCIVIAKEYGPWNNANTIEDIFLLVKNGNKKHQKKCKVCSYCFLLAIWLP